MKKDYTNADFGKDFKKSFTKKKKTSMASPFKPVKIFNPKVNMGVGNKVGTPQMGGTTQAQMDSAQANSKVLMKKDKKSEKKSKMKSTKKKVSHLLQETSMCKDCKTSHKPGKHSKK